MQQRSSIIKSTIRRRIVMHSGAQNLVLYESKLAHEFGLSRTPIRQVIQSLAAESLVEVRSGVGTIAAPMPQDRLKQDLKAYSAILGACAACSSPANFNKVKIELATLRVHLEADSQVSPSDLFFDVATKFIEIICDLVDDVVLRGALVSCYWRFVRRRVAEHKGDFAAITQEMIKTTKDAEYGAETGDPEHILRMVQTNVDVMIKSSVNS